MTTGDYLSGRRRRGVGCVNFLSAKFALVNINDRESVIVIPTSMKSPPSSGVKMSQLLDKSRRLPFS